MITVEHLSKNFTIRKRRPGFLGAIKGLFTAEKENIAAVDDVNFTIQKGELVGYLGPNGAGKSTTIKMLTGILQPSSGKIRINDVDPTRERRKLTRQLGVVFGQKTQLWWDLPVGESFDLLRTIYHIDASVFKARMEMFHDLLGIADFERQQTRKLSLGQRMRADLAASLLHNPPVLFLDEPTIGLDILTRDAIRDFIKELNRTEKTTIILTTHDITDVEYLANRLILLDKGRVQYDGTIADFNSRYTKEKIVTIHLETPCAEGTLEGVASLGYKLTHSISSLHHEVSMSTESSLDPLLAAISGGGGKIREINVRKQDLGDTLKLLYGGSKVEL